MADLMQDCGVLVYYVQFGCSTGVDVSGSGSRQGELTREGRLIAGYRLYDRDGLQSLGSMILWD